MTGTRLRRGGFKLKVVSSLACRGHGTLTLIDLQYEYDYAMRCDMIDVSLRLGVAYSIRFDQI